MTNQNKLLLTSLFFTFQLIISAQGHFYEGLDFGDYNVAFSDTIIYDDSVHYKQYDYDGKAPLFVQLWYPTKNLKNQKPLTFEELRRKEVPKDLKDVYKALCAHMDTSFIDYNIKEDYPEYNMIDYGEYSYHEVLNKIKTCETRSFAQPLKEVVDCPVIVYHHGAQGLSDENFVMAEYFASKGFLVIAANFHLPYAGLGYGSVRYSGSSPPPVEITNTKALINFAKTISKNENIIYIGHSWGAQIGWIFLHEKEWVDAFVSMETTIEFQNEEAKIKEMWSDVYNALKVQKNQFSIPILLFANTRKDKPFDFFSNTSPKEMTFISAKEDFSHESYTSVYLMRYFFRDQFKQPDTEVMSRQIELYAKHIEIVEQFIESVLQNKTSDLSDYQTDFFIHKSHTAHK